MTLTLLQEVLTVLEEVKRLDEAQAEHSRKWAMLAKRARAGEKVERERDALSSTVVDYGDVWARLRALHPKVKWAVKREVGT